MFLEVLQHKKRENQERGACGPETERRDPGKLGPHTPVLGSGGRQMSVVGLECRGAETLIKSNRTRNKGRWLNGVKEKKILI